MKSSIYPILLVPLFLHTLLASPAPAQTDAEDAVDSAMRRRDDLFVDVEPRLDTLDEEAPRDSVEWRHKRWEPEFSAHFARADILGLRDRPDFFSYDRADGLFLGVGFNLPARILTERGLRGHFGFGYGFGSHYWQVAGGLSQDFLSSVRPLRLSAEGHIVTDTRDAWKMLSSENTAFALVAGVDSRDYFQRRGFSAGLEQHITPRASLAAEFRYDIYRNSRREVGWSLFGPEQPFREVPPIIEGPMSSIVFRFLADYMTLRSWSDPQFAFAVQYEIGGGRDNNDVDSATGEKRPYDFGQLVVDARVKATIVSHLIYVAVHGRVGAAFDQAPRQRLFTIGGFGTLPGFPQNEYEGSRLLLLQTDLLIQPSTSRPLKSVRIILSNDFGAVGYPEAGTSGDFFSGMPSDVEDLKYSIGIYLGSSAGRFRIGAAFRTDRMEAPTFVLRFGERF